ncbi:Transcriptional regulatory protein DegU [compost metagenome]
MPTLTLHPAANAQQALEMLEHHDSITNVIMDYYLPDMAGADLLRRMRQRRSQLRVLVLSASQDPEDERRAREAGAQAFMNKSASCQELVAALDAMNDGALPAHRVVANGVSATTQDEAALLLTLTPRQQEVLRLMCDGLRNKEISERLSMTEKTVKTHVSAILATLGVLNRTQATLVARRGGVFGRPT